MARFIPIVITGEDRGAKQTIDKVTASGQKMESTFEKIDKQVDLNTKRVDIFGRIGQSALQGINQELLQTLRNIPLVGQPLAHITQELFNINRAGNLAASGTKNAKQEVAELAKLLPALQKAFEQPAFAGLNKSGRKEPTELFKTFNQLGIKTRVGEAVKPAEIDDLKKIAKAIHDVDEDWGRAALSQEIFGNKAKDALPILEKYGASVGSVAAESETATAATAGMGGSIAAIAGPVGIALAAIAALLLLVGSLGAAEYKLANIAAEYGDETFKAVQKTKLHTETLGALRVVAEENDVSFSQLTSGLAQYLGNVEKAAQGDRKLRAELASLGIDAKAAAQNPQAAVEQLIAAFERLGPSAEENQTAIKLVGQSGLQLIPVLRELHGSLGAATDKARAFGLVMSEEDARQAHEFEKSLRDLKLQMQGILIVLGKEFLPKIHEYLLSLSDFLKEHQRDWKALSIVIGAVVDGSIAYLKLLKDQALLSLGAIGQLILGYQKLKQLKDSIQDTINPKVDENGVPKVEGVQGPQNSPLPNSEEELNGNLDLLKTYQEEARRIAANEVAEAERSFKTGNSTRKQEVEAIITANNQKLQADLAALELSRQLKQKEFEEAKNDFTKRVKLSQEIIDLNQKSQSLQSEFDRDAANRRTELAVQETRDMTEHMKRLVDIKIAGLESQNKTFKQQHDLGKLDNKEFLEQTEANENRIIALKQESLTKQLSFGNIDVAERQRLKDELTKIEIEKTTLLNEQAARRDQIAEKEKAHSINLLTQQLDTSLEIRRIKDDAAIAAFRAAGQARIISAEQTERAILQIELTSIDSQIEALKLKQEFAKTISDPHKQTEELAHLNGQIQVLTAQRTEIEKKGNRDIADGRQADLTNLRQYNDQLRSLSIENQGLEIELQRAKLERFERLGANPEFVRQGRDALDAAEEAARYRQAVANFQAKKASIDLTGKTAEQKAQIEAYFNSQQLLLEQAHQDRLAEIRERPLQRYIEKVKSYADEVGDIFANSFDSLFEKGKSFWSRMEDGFKHMFEEIVHSYIKTKVSRSIQSLFDPSLANDNSQLSNHASNSGGGFSLRNLLNLGGSNQGGISVGGFSGGTQTFGGSQQSGGISGLVNNFRQNGFVGGIKSILGFGSSAVTGATGAASASGMAGGLASLGAGAAGAAATVGGLAIGAGSAGAAAGAGMAGGLSALGGAGAAGGASGFAALVPLLTNPITAIVAGAAVGAFLLWRHFRNGTEKKLRETIQSEYGIAVKEMQTLTQIKQIGEQSFGKGQVSNHLLETIRLEPVKELLASYAEATGQKSNLVTNKQLMDPSNAANQFVRRISGGIIPGPTLGFDHVPILGDGGEHMVDSATAAREGHGALDALRAGRATIVPKPKISSAPIPQREQSSSGQSSQGSQGSTAQTAVMQAHAAIMERVATALEGIEGISEEELITRMAKKKPRVFVDAVNKALGESYGKRQLQQKLNL